MRLVTMIMMNRHCINIELKFFIFFKFNSFAWVYVIDIYTQMNVSSLNKVTFTLVKE